MFSSWKTSPFLCLGIFLWITLHVQCRPSSSSTDHDPGTTDITKCAPNDTVPPNRVNTSVQLNLVRQEMTRVNITVLIIPLDSVGRLKWVSGFSGSNGEAVITHDEGMSMNQIVESSLSWVTCCSIVVDWRKIFYSSWWSTRLQLEDDENGSKC